MKFWCLVFTVRGDLHLYPITLRNALLGDVRSTDPKDPGSSKFLKKNPASEELRRWSRQNIPDSVFTGYIGARQNSLSPEAMGEVVSACCDFEIFKDQRQNSDAQKYKTVLFAMGDPAEFLNEISSRFKAYLEIVPHPPNSGNWDHLETSVVIKSFNVFCTWDVQ